jgi:hypothetical protein
VPWLPSVRANKALQGEPPQTFDLSFSYLSPFNYYHTFTVAEFLLYVKIAEDAIIEWSTSAKKS